MYMKTQQVLLKSRSCRPPGPPRFAVIPLMWTPTRSVTPVSSALHTREQEAKRSCFFSAKPGPAKFRFPAVGLRR